MIELKIRQFKYSRSGGILAKEYHSEAGCYVSAGDPIATILENGDEKTIRSPIEGVVLEFGTPKQPALRDWSDDLYLLLEIWPKDAFERDTANVTFAKEKMVVHVTFDMTFPDLQGKAILKDTRQLGKGVYFLDSDEPALRLEFENEARILSMPVAGLVAGWGAREYENGAFYGINLQIILGYRPKGTKTKQLSNYWLDYIKTKVRDEGALDYFFFPEPRENATPAENSPPKVELPDPPIVKTPPPESGRPEVAPDVPAETQRRIDKAASILDDDF
ncbi:MAG: hypothetical protein AAGA72_00405 [Pseudomonadota bacterium]